jgi:hypothetical protein
MARDRDNRPVKREEKENESLNRKEMDKQKVDKTYVKNANASGLGSIGRSDESMDDNDSGDKVY